jgi:hypothetical protein
MSIIEIIKEQDEKFARSILDLENFVCTLGRLVDDIIDKDLGLCVDYKLVEDAVELLEDKKWMDSTRSNRWKRVVQGLCDDSVKKLTMTKLVDNQEDDLVEEDYRVAQLKGEV